MRIKSIILIVITSLLVINCSDDKVVDANDDFVTAEIKFAPIPVLSAGKINVAYNIDFSDFSLKGIKLISVKLFNKTKSTLIADYTDSLLNQRLVLTSDPPPTDQEKIHGTKKQSHPVFYNWLKLDPANVPTEISHEFIFRILSTNKDTTIVGAVAKLNNIPPVVISPPMKGKGWLVIETTDLLTHHFKSQATYNGITSTPERFAVDYLQLDSNNQSTFGDPKINENWVIYGKELIAVADGKITATHDGVPNNVPVGHIPTMDIMDMAGNYVILNIGNNNYVTYCHIIPGTIKVSVGQNVKKGDVLGLIGNSGNSDAPHLHFQVTNANSFIGSEGVPYLFDRFYSVATVKEVDGELVITKYPERKHIQNELIENWRILDFE